MADQSLPDSVETVVLAPSRDLGDGFSVRRALPSAHRRMVGPFIFLDQMGPVHFADGHALDVRPHPHIGLATVTYLFDGEILHRDSLGNHLPIRPGEVNWMTAGRGIVHSERTPDHLRAGGGSLFGIQTWVALPVEHEETAPDFTHYAADAIPRAAVPGVQFSLIAGTAEGMASPVKTFSDMIYADLVLEAGARWRFAAEHVERAVYVVTGALQVEGQDGAFGEGQLVVLKPGAEVVLTTDRPSRLMLAGGEPYPEKRLVTWNFVSSRADRIEQAKADWREGRFDPVPGETEWIPLPPDVPGAHLK